MAYDRDGDGFGPDELRALVPVSRETIERLQAYLAALDEWRQRMNLIGPGEGSRIWRRHVLDSIQLLPDLTEADDVIADLGSGAGFPGLVLACALADSWRPTFYLVEKSPKKCGFLEAAARQAGLNVVILNQRIEDPPPQRVRVVTARALSPLPGLMSHLETWLTPDGRGLFLKGRSGEQELTTAGEHWQFHSVVRPSLSGPDGHVLTISSPMRRKV